MEQAEAQTSGLKKNTIKKQVLLGGRRISEEMSKAGEWTMSRRKAKSTSEYPEVVVTAEATTTASCYTGKNAVKREMLKKVQRSISMISHTLSSTEEADDEDSVVAVSTQRLSTNTLQQRYSTNSLRLPGAVERSVSVCEESMGSARKMLEDMFGRRPPPPLPQLSEHRGPSKSSLFCEIRRKAQPHRRQRTMSLGDDEPETAAAAKQLPAYAKKMRKFIRDTTKAEWNRACDGMKRTELDDLFDETLHDLVAMARSIPGTSDLVALDNERGSWCPRMNAYSRSLDLLFPRRKMIKRSGLSVLLFVERFSISFQALRVSGISPIRETGGGEVGFRGWSGIHGQMLTFLAHVYC
jgi:hypothetical protein